MSTARRELPHARRARPTQRRAAPPRARPNLRVVTVKRPRRTRRIAFLVLAFALVSSLVLAVVSAQALVSQGSFKMETLSKRAALLRQDHGRLRLQVAELSAPARIVREAKRLGMRLPDSGAVQIIPVTTP